MTKLQAAEQKLESRINALTVDQIKDVAKLNNAMAGPDSIIVRVALYERLETLIGDDAAYEFFVSLDA